jgi:beta-xylosidase
MKTEHLFQVLVSEIAFQEIRIHALSAYIAKQLNVSMEEIESFLDQYAPEKRAASVQSVHLRMERKMRDLGGDTS